MENDLVNNSLKKFTNDLKKEKNMNELLRGSYQLALLDEVDDAIKNETAQRENIKEDLSINV